MPTYHLRDRHGDVVVTVLAADDTDAQAARESWQRSRPEIVEAVRAEVGTRQALADAGARRSLASSFARLGLSEAGTLQAVAGRGLRGRRLAEAALSEPARPTPLLPLLGARARRGALRTGRPLPSSARKPTYGPAYQVESAPTDADRLAASFRRLGLSESQARDAADGRPHHTPPTRSEDDLETLELLG